ncbi:hypothetical protein DL546_002126 [Coniochaeta pulveracea]|uniref:Uncharacterized protein n=1 Tax=Coniochaeta pulveracea TaxID=177199 RepID=A0A420YCL1_9PEZI|nr:hypothetical protein DL546_002126 [Coniochaeta pulveracea]
MENNIQETSVVEYIQDSTLSSLCFLVRIARGVGKQKVERAQQQSGPHRLPLAVWLQECFQTPKPHTSGYILCKKLTRPSSDATKLPQSKRDEGWKDARFQRGSAISEGTWHPFRVICPLRR